MLDKYASVNTYSNEYDPKKNYKYYVTCTDKFMSGWGGCNNRTSKFIVACENYNQARKIQYNLDCEKNFIYVNIRTSKPHYNVLYYHSHFTTFSECTAYNK